MDRPPAMIEGDYMLGRAKLEARAALEAVLPDIAEACAKVADCQPTVDLTEDEQKEPVMMAGFMGEFGMKRAIASSIRSLTKTESENE